MTGSSTNATSCDGNHEGHVVIALGSMFFLASVIALILHQFKQSVIVACIATGMIGGIWHDELEEHLPADLVHALSELGILFVLFSAGMEVDIKGFMKTWKVAVVQGAGQIVLNLIIFVPLGTFLFKLSDFTSAFYFGLCATLSSTIVCVSILASRRETSSQHGQIILAVMVFQDISAVLSLAVLETLDPAFEGDLGESIGLLIAKLIGLLVILFIIRNFVLERWFRWQSVTGDLLFISALGYPLGVAACCMELNFSGEMGAFWAGVSMASLPYKLEIEKKVEGIKMFGVVLFFITLGFDLQFTADEFMAAVPNAAVLAGLVVFISPLVFFPLAALSGLPGSIAFYTGFVVNQISEFSIIIALSAQKLHIFSYETYFAIVLATLFSIACSSVIHLFLDKLHNLVQKTGCLRFNKSKSAGDSNEASASHSFSNHILLLGYTELSQSIMDHLGNSKDIALITMWPDVIQAFHKGKEGHGHGEVKISPAPESAASANLSRVHCLYNDLFEPHAWEHAGIDSAEMVVLCVPDKLILALELVKRLKKAPKPIPLVVACSSYKDARRLYEAGVAFVCQIEHQGAEHFMNIMNAEMRQGPSAFLASRDQHLKEMEALHTRLGDKLFYAL